MKMCKVLLLIFCSLASGVLAQNIIEPEKGEVEFMKLQATDGTDGDPVVERVVRSFKAVVPAGEEAWIPLGHFEWGELHKLIVAAKGHSALSNAEVTFSTSWGGWGTAIRTLNQYNTQGRFRLYWRPSHDTGFGRGIRVFMKYKNISPANNIVRIEHQGVHYGSWREDEITQVDIDEGIEMKGKIELQTGYANYPDYNLIRGTYLNDNVSVNGSLKVNGESVLTESSLNSLSSGGIGIGGVAPANTNTVKVYANKSIAAFASANLENGGLIVQGNGGSKLAIDPNEIVGASTINYATLASQSKHKFIVPDTANHREVIADFGLRGNGNRGVVIGNGTNTNGQMISTLTGYTDISREALQVSGSVQPSADVAGKAAIDISARIHTGAGNPLNSGMGHLQNRDIFQVRNHTTKVMLVSNKGQTKLTNTAWKANPSNDFSEDEVNNYGEALQVEGNTSLLGDVEIKGDLKLSKPQGDISMGVFGE